MIDDLTPPHWGAEPITTAPERIWARPDYNECWPKRLEEEDVEYIRADLAAVQPAKVRVKPLVWEDMIGRIKCDTTSIVGPYEVYQDVAWITLWFNGARIGGACASIEAAKSAAQADYEARIFAVLEPQPDPRDEVLNQAMKDAITMGEGWIRTLQDGTLQLIDPSAVRLMPDATDPRDEVIARLVGALEMAKVWLDYNGACDMQGINAALAAAKEIIK